MATARPYFSRAGTISMGSVDRNGNFIVVELCTCDLMMFMIPNMASAHPLGMDRNNLADALYVELNLLSQNILTVVLSAKKRMNGSV